MQTYFEYLDPILCQHNLQNPNLNILIPDISLYNTLVYQHKGEIEASVNGGKYIRNKDRATAVDKFNKFFKKAIEVNSDLALTPEYSCPWESIGMLMENRMFPKNKKIWICGCESIMPEQFRKFIKKYNDDSVTLIFEQAAHDSSQDKFLNPIIYFFKTKDKDEGTDKVVLVFQFKSHPMGAEFQFEADNMLPGTKKYILRNSISSIYLITIICSESFVFNQDQDELNFLDKPYLIYHPQLNFNSRAPNFINYRTNLYNNKQDPYKDIICLNWARGTNSSDKKIEDSFSAIYIKSNAIPNKVEDSRINTNDKLGLYFHHWEVARTGIFVFNYDEALYLFENFKPSVRGEAAQYGLARRGPKMLDYFEWDQSEWNSNTPVLNNDLIDSCKYIEGIDYLIKDELSPINRERFLSLSAGRIDSRDWPNPSKNSLFKMNNEEKSYRIALFQDTKTKHEKENLLAKISTLQKIFQDPRNIPDKSQLEDLKEGCRFHYTESNTCYNVVSKKDIAACLVYVGDMTLNNANRIRDIIINKEMENKSNTLIKRTVVWYNSGGLQVLHDPSPPQATDNPERNIISFKKKTNND